MTKFLTRKYIAQMNFDEWDADRQQRVADSNAGVRKSTGVEKDEVHTLRRGELHPVNNFVFGIALEANELVVEIAGKILQSTLNLRKVCVAVYAAFTSAKQIEVGTIDE